MTHQTTSECIITTIGIDLGKNTFHLIGMDARGRIVLRRKVSRGQLLQCVANLPVCLIGLEACAGAHHVGRQLAALGHDVRLLPAQYVKPFLKGHKNDYRDAEAIAEAAQRPTMRPVPLKSAEQLDLQALHRVRSRLVGQRTAVINQIRAFLLECGIPVRQGPAGLREALPSLLAQRTDVLSPRMIHLIEDLAGDWRRLDERIEMLTRDITALARQDAGCQRLMGIPGVGVITASAMVAAIAPEPHSPRAATLPPGSVWCRSRSRPVTGRSWVACPSAATATCARCSWVGHKFSCSAYTIGRDTASAAGFQQQPRGCTGMCSPRLWPTSSPASPGASYTASVATRPRLRSGCRELFQRRVIRS
jgi:transposase